MTLFFGLKKSLVAKLVLAFVLVSVVPMLVASQIATSLISNVINKNIERWLSEATSYMHLSIHDTAQSMKAICSLLESRFAEEKTDFSPDELRAFADIGVDALWLYDAAGTPLYTSTKATHGKSLFPDGPFQWLRSDDEEYPAITQSCHLKTKDGTSRTLALGSLFSIDYLEHASSGPIILRIFVPDAGSFQQAYSSATTQYHLPHKALTAFQKGAETYFSPKAEWTDEPPGTYSLLSAVRGKHGEVLAIFVTSATLLPFNGWLTKPSVLFWGFFILGTLLAGGIGYVLARKMVTPLKQLNNGVRRIAAGNLDVEVAVHGDDEVAELTSGFNLMTKQLQIMRHDSIQSARQERSRMLGEIALGFAHEIRNPLVVIKTSAEVVLSSLKTQPKESRLLGFVVEEVARINNLISEFLSFAKSSPPTLEYFSLAPLIQEIIELSSAELDNRKIASSIENTLDEDQALGDRSQIRQVLLNLFLNAMDAMPQGGILSVRLYTEQGRPCIEVKDTGGGIAPELLPTIHMPFISTKKNGLGLGLSKVHAIIEEHGGSISCASSPGEGAVFTICLKS